MLQYYIARLKKHRDNLDSELIRWIRIVASPTPLGTDEERIREIVDLVTAYRIVKGCFLSSKITPKNRVFLPILVMGIFYRCFISACFIL